jgi:hypothetical protein
LLRESKRGGTANNHGVVRNSLIDYFQWDHGSFIYFTFFPGGIGCPPW